MCGIIQREYDIYRKQQGEPPRDVRNLTQDEGYAIYYASYWMPYCPKLPVGLDMQFFDASVNEGPKEAVRILQMALSITEDGEWGPQTDKTVSEIKDVKAVIQAYTSYRKEVYRGLKGFIYFGTDWIRRATEVGDESLTMASTVVIAATATPVATPNTGKDYRIL
jgi:lysozyme family protein